jgi:hypothetical protein
MAKMNISKASLVVMACVVFPTLAAPAIRSQLRAAASPFDPIDPQKWVNPDNMTWSDFKAPPGTTWGDRSRQGRDRNFNIALVTVDYPDSPFVVTLEPHSDIFTNPQPSGSGLKREDVPKFYSEMLNTPNELNKGHTLHEYWMGDSFGKYGVNLTVFGPYRMPSKTWQYGIDSDDGGFNEGACPAPPCSVDLRTDALGAWRREVGNATANAFELAFILSAGQDESSTWQEFGEMRFDSPEDVPEEFGHPEIARFPTMQARVMWSGHRGLPQRLSGRMQEGGHLHKERALAWAHSPTSFRICLELVTTTTIPTAFRRAAHTRVLSPCSTAAPSTVPVAPTRVGRFHLLRVDRWVPFTRCATSTKSS